MDSSHVSGDYNEDFNMPPGTTHLLQEISDHANIALTLHPTPSSDPNEPLNWTKGRKFINFGLVLAVTLTIFTTLSVQILFWQYLVIDLKASFTQLNNAASINATGLTVGCVFFIPFTIKYGRRPIYIISTAIMFIMCIWTSRMTTVWEMYVTNLFFGLAGATNESIVGLTVADLFFVHQRGTMNGFYLIMVLTGSFLTPLVAGVQATNQNWRWSYYLLALFTGLLTLAFIFFYEETKYIPVQEGRSESSFSSTGPESTSSKEAHTKVDPADGKETTIAADQALNDRINHEIPLHTYKQRMRFTTPTDEPLLRLFYRPFIILFSFPAVLFTALQYGAGLSWLVNMAATMAVTFPYPPYMFTSAQVGLLGIGPFIGNMIGSVYSGYLNDKSIVFFAKRNKGYYEPEMRLYLLHLPTASMFGGLVMFGVTLAKGMHWIYPCVGGALFGFGLGSFGDSSLTLTMDSYRGVIGEAFVGIAFVRNLFSIVMAQVRTPWMVHMGIQNMYILMGGLSLLVSLLYIPMIYTGKRFRGATAAKYRVLSERRQ